jgi:hypothetical protein
MCSFCVKGICNMARCVVEYTKIGSQLDRSHFHFDRFTRQCPHDQSKTKERGTIT